jgi:PGF-pre-PGF domain-containing protein
MNATLYVNGTAVNSSNGTNSSNLTYVLANDGNYSYSSNVIDISGKINFTPQVSNIIIDKTAPALTINSANYTNSTTVSITGNYTEANIANITVNGITASLNTSVKSYNVTLSLSEGNNTVTATAFDLAGNTNNASSWIVSDTVAPNYGANSSYPPSPANYSESGSYQFNVTWNDNNSGVSTALLQFNGTEYSMNSSGSNGTYSVTISNIAVGNYSYRFWANDSAGNSNQTGYINYTANQGTPGLHLYLNGSETNLTVGYGVKLNITGSGCPVQLNCTLYRDGLTVTNPDYTTSLNYNQNYTYMYNTSGNSNYTPATTQIYQVSVQALASNQNITNETIVNITGNITTVFIQNTNVSAITIDPNITDMTEVTISFCPVLNALSWNVALGDNNLTLQRSTSAGNVSIDIPNGTVIIGGSGWDGSAVMPTIESASSFTAPTPGTGASTANLVIEVGNPSISLNLSQPARIILPGMAGKNAAWGINATLTNISTICNSPTNYTNINPTLLRECYVDSGSDLAIWTYHFTNFAAYTYTPPFCGDGTCNGAETCSTCSADCGSCPPSGGGGGGGGSTASSVLTATQIWDQIAADSTATMAIPSTLNATVTEVDITAKNNVTNAQLSVSKLNSSSAAVSNLTTSEADKVYQYFEIKATNLANANIKEAKIKFHVAKTWLTENGVSEDAVVLHRWTTQWDNLSTTKTGENSSDVYYEALTPGFSIFAVLAIAAVPVQTCTPGAKRCSGSNLQQCGVSGTSWTTTESCNYGCNATALSCNLATPVSGVTRCPTCPVAGAWNTCVNDSKSRTNYRCNTNTNWTCETYTETQSCAETQFLPIGIGAVIVIIAASVLLVKKQKKYSRKKRRLKK